MNKNYSVLDKRRSLGEKTFSTLLIFTLLAFCAWISQGSTWWTFVTGLLFITILFGKAAIFVKEKNNTFETKDQLQKWVDGLEDL